MRKKTHKFLKRLSFFILLLVLISSLSFSVSAFDYSTGLPNTQDEIQSVRVYCQNVVYPYLLYLQQDLNYPLTASSYLNAINTASSYNGMANITNSYLDVVKRHSQSLLTDIDIYEDALSSQKSEIERFEFLNQTFKTQWENASANQDNLVNSLNEANATIEELRSQLEVADSDEKIQNAYNKGYSQALKDGEIMEETLLTTFSSPLYIFGEMLNFDLFGINIYYIVLFLITLLLSAWILKKVF